MRIWCPHQSDAQTISPGTVAFDGLDISSDVLDGTKYAGKRDIRSSDLKIATEEWTETLPNGTVNKRVKPPESEVYTFGVRARGQEKIDLSVNPNGAATYDIGSFRETDLQPTALSTGKEFYTYGRAKCSVIRTYEGGYIPNYYDTCIPIANEGYKSVVLAGTEPLAADASVTPLGHKCCLWDREPDYENAGF